jgi:hypothetical protein
MPSNDYDPTYPNEEQPTQLDHSGHTVVSQGTDVDEVIIEDYWGTSETTKYFMPDGVQWFEIKKMNEGDRSRYQYEAQLKMTTKRKTGDTEIDLDQAKDRRALIMNSVVNWHMRKEGVWLPFNRQALGAWIVATNPNYVDNLISKIRKFNPFLQEDLSSADIREQIKDLEEMLVVAEKREAEADFSPAK